MGWGEGVENYLSVNKKEQAKGMDLIAIIEHKKSPDELVNIQQVIDHSYEFKNTYSNQYPNSEIRKSNWNGPHKMTKENLVRIWEVEERGEDPSVELKGLNYYAEMDIPYAELKFHRRTVSISPHGLHKYGNFRIPKWASFIIKMNREIANIFNSQKIVYCVDSYEPTEIIYDKSLAGATLEEIINFGNEKFGIPPKEIIKAIKNFYFIDKFDLNLKELVEFQDYN